MTTKSFSSTAGESKGQAGAAPELGPQQNASAASTGGPTRRQSAELRPAEQVQVLHLCSRAPGARLGARIKRPVSYDRGHRSRWRWGSHGIKSHAKPAGSAYDLPDEALFRTHRAQVSAPKTGIVGVAYRALVWPVSIWIMSPPSNSVH